MCDLMLSCQVSGGVTKRCCGHSETCFVSIYSCQIIYMSDDPGILYFFFGQPSLVIFSFIHGGPPRPPTPVHCPDPVSGSALRQQRE